jgi:HSP20 family protein
MRRRDNPLSNLERMVERMSEQFDDVGMEWTREGGGSGRPSTDVVDRETEVVVAVDVPGFDRDDIDLQVTDRTLRVRARRDEETATEGEEYVRRERRHESIERSLRLPTAVDPDAAEATLQNGVLTVTLPKAGEGGHSVDIDVR